ncbi:4Fe-4S dicluster domain-containing protein [Geobacter argillaceus]|uniref:Dissimilatory sulfite reductase (Desulfoviridin) alpha/beta subunit n=1 Tax=Geobacter argillaceus TaxID=345631 RepID=A0A562VMS3_9BACT|nr:4Fe-4S dicluster domain-containing protein [Geobacter argillaceus]TWJ19092.1 dissimilatory sulfite reductase (desulfoviridin) alpha/beta subunit [Geobacter argillaceus]
MSEQKNTTQIDLKNLKAGGFIKERGKDLFTVRLRVPGGRMSVERLKRIAAVADKYGKGFVHLSVRQSIELININFRDFDAVVDELGEKEQKVASCGARVRVPTACGGCEYNPNGLVDTQRSALEVDEKLFGTVTGHHKFKVGFAGCPFDCPKSATNDVGFQGAIWPELQQDECISCGLCAKSCTEGAITMGGDGKPLFSADSCLYCGDCVKVCPTEAWKTARKGYTVRIGGKWGRRPLIGTLYAEFLPEEQVVEFVHELLAWYGEKAEGLGRIRIGDIILKEGSQSLVERLRSKFPDHVVKETIPPAVIPTQVGKR